MRLRDPEAAARLDDRGEPEAAAGVRFEERAGFSGGAWRLPEDAVAFLPEDAEARLPEDAAAPRLPLDRAGGSSSITAFRPETRPLPLRLFFFEFTTINPTTPPIPITRTTAKIAPPPPPPEDLDPFS